MSPPNPADTALAERLGVPARSIATLRKQKLTPGEHWISHPKLSYTPEGEARVRELLELPPAEPEPQPCLVAPAVEPILCTVVKIRPNPIWVGIRTPEDVLAVVKVRNNHRLRVGVTIQCQKEVDRWVCVQREHKPRN